MSLSPISKVIVILGLLVPVAQAQHPDALQRDVSGAVYVATNDATANAVLVFTRAGDGRLDPHPAMFATGGTGTGAGLGNQGGVMLSPNDRFLFVVNAGSNQISIFQLEPRGLELIDLVESNGRQPISLAQSGDLVYVLHSGGLVGGQDQVVGFRLQSDGQLSRIAGALQPLSARSTNPAQVGFAREGQVLVVTEKDTNTITTYLVGAEGQIGAPLSQPSAGLTPFGFGLGKRDQLFVSEAFGPRPEHSSAVSSYRVGAEGLLAVISPSVPTHQVAACWIAVSGGGRFVYTTNTGSDSITGFSVSFDGALTILGSDGVTAVTGDAPIDMDFSSDERFLYVLNSGDGTISSFLTSGDGGELSHLPSVGGLPAGANGLAAR